MLGGGAHPRGMSNKTYNILVVDDEPNVLSVTQSVLQGELLCDVLTASSAGEALEAAQEKEIAVLVCDYKMPVMNGLELMNRVLRLNP